MNQEFTPISSASLKLIVQLAGAGWADASIIDGSNVLTTDISYLSDGIGEMASAAKAILHGAATARFAFQHEPGEHVFVLTRGSSDNLRIDIFENRDSFDGKTRSPVMTIDCAVMDFVGQVFSNLHTLRLEDEEDYRKRWNHDFPIDAYESIRRVI